jgi:hypothetical protein
MPFCSSCGANLAAGSSFCATCGRPVVASGPQGATLSPPAWAAPPTQVHVHVAPAERPVSVGMAVAGLVLNVLVWPGLGSLVAGEMIGWAQGFLTLLGVILIVTIVGIVVGLPRVVGMWIWGIVTGVQLINRASAQQRAAAGFA